MRDSRLLTELSGHIQPTIARLRAGIPVENPLLKEFQESYPSVYKACEEGLSLLCPILGIKSSRQRNWFYYPLFHNGNGTY